MKKYLSKILITVIVIAIFIVPVSASIKIKKAEAAPLDCIVTPKASTANPTPLSQPFRNMTKVDCQNQVNGMSQESTAIWTAEDGTSQILEGTAKTASSGTAFTGGSGTDPDYDLGCTVFNGGTGIVGCIAKIFYLFFQVGALIMELAGKFLDFFVYYSTDSGSYRNEFVEKGWGAVRDVANIFFIIALLYIAIKTVLSLEGSNSKKLIANIIIIALIINFSLFTTKVVIDASNIIAKIFYNNISSKTKINGVVTDSAAGAGGEKSISIGLVKKFNPHTIIAKDDYDATGENKNKAGPGEFLFVTLILIVIVLYTAYIFFSVALLFVSRVISLWISMIFAPLAFISYTVPFDIPGFGHKRWWDELLKNAFLAPLFIFFLYIIVLFLEVGVVDPSANYGVSSFQKIMNVIIPFVIIAVLLTKAKKLAVEYSGDMGKAVMTGAKMVGGLALGAATAGMGLALRSTAGRGLAAAANSGLARKWEASGWGGGLARRALEAGGRGSFDIKGIKIAGQNLASVTGMKVGEGQKGGFEQMRKNKVEKRRKRAESLKVGEDEEITQKINVAEMDLQVLLNKVAADFSRLDKALEDQRQIKTDNANSPVGSPGAALHDAAVVEIERLKNEKKGLKDGTGTGAPSVIGGANAGKTIKELENSTNGIITLLKNEKQTESRRRTTKFANTIQGNKFTRIVAGRGGKANREAQHKIIMESPLDSGTKT